MPTPETHLGHPVFAAHHPDYTFRAQRVALPESGIELQFGAVVVNNVPQDGFASSLRITEPCGSQEDPTLRVALMMARGNIGKMRYFHRAKSLSLAGGHELLDQAEVRLARHEPLVVDGRRDIDPVTTVMQILAIAHHLGRFSLFEHEDRFVPIAQNYSRNVFQSDNPFYRHVDTFIDMVPQPARVAA